jgi:hypothetical protein
MLKTSEDWFLQHKSVKSKSRTPLDFGGTALVASRQTGQIAMNIAENRRMLVLIAFEIFGTEFINERGRRKEKLKHVVSIVSRQSHP